MPWTTGKQLRNGKYVIDTVLGQGGFGITYKALQINRNRQVVIKTPNEYLQYDPEYNKYAEQFKQEGQKLARLSEHLNSHIVGVIELFQEDNTHCLVMDYVPGENLFEIVKHRGALPEDEILDYFLQIGNALASVHEEGLVHRDAHPRNIMLRSDGQAILIDFGIAKELVPKTLSSTGNAGNHAFAPYEQITKGSRKPTVDIYCLAATLYYAATGQSPISSLARKLHNTPLIQPKQINPSISKQLNRVILKGMALEAKRRPQSMQAWLQMLEKVRERKPNLIHKIKLWMARQIKVTQKELLENLRNIANQIQNLRFQDVITMIKVLPYLHCMFYTISYIILSTGLIFLFTGSIVATLISSIVFLLLLKLVDTWDYPLLIGICPSFIIAILGGHQIAAPATFFLFWLLAWMKIFKVELRKNFSQFNTFVILASTSGFGLYLGWLIYWSFKPST